MIIEKNERAQPVCVFGKLYGDVSEASDVLRQMCNITDNGKTMKIWVSSKKHKYNVFYVTKEFYEEMKDTARCITQDMYNAWSTAQNTERLTGLVPRRHHA